MDASHVDKGIGKLRYETGTNATKRFNVMSDTSNDTEENTINPSLTAKYSGDAVEVTSITSYINYRYQLLSDLDRTSTFNGYSTIDLKQEGVTQELRFASPGERRFNWLFGLFGSSSQTDVQFNLIAPSPLPRAISTPTPPESSHMPASVRPVLHSRHSASHGGRSFARGLRLRPSGQTYRTKKTSVTGYSKELDSIEVLPMASLAYDITPNATAYATWSNGFLAGGFNYYSANSLETFSYQPEHTTNYELGLKPNWFDKKLTANSHPFLYGYPRQAGAEERPQRRRPGVEVHQRACGPTPRATMSNVTAMAPGRPRTPGRPRLRLHGHRRLDRHP
jgi:iron complex outermembrane receptor protein